MKIAVMQPYLFPYIGYWQLLNAVDIFVILDDVNFIKRGYINRNSILINGKVFRFTVPIRNASQNSLIMNTQLSFSQEEKNSFIARIKYSYKKAPYFQAVMPLIEKIIQKDTDDLTEFIQNSMEEIGRYLRISTDLVKSSSLEKNNLLTGQSRILEICDRLNADIYINPSGAGKTLYQKETFEEHNVKLYFLNTKWDRIVYKQFSDEFIDSLSIIDILMFNDAEKIKKYLEEYELE